MSNPLVSVIIPIYNAQSTLRACVNSVICQSYKTLEILLINDGSTDKSLDICNELKEEDERIIVVNKENGGVSSTRNLGIKFSRGEFIAFIDSDDLIEPDYIKELYSVIQDCDMTICGYKQVTQTKTDEHIPEPNTFDIAPAHATEIKRACDGLYLYVPWGKLFRSSIIKKNNLFFNESLKLTEDTCFVLDFLNLCDRIAFIPYLGYIYDFKNGYSKYKMPYETFKIHYRTYIKSISNIEKKIKANLKRLRNASALPQAFLYNLFDIKSYFKFCTEAHCFYFFYGIPFKNNTFRAKVYWFIVLNCPELYYWFRKCRS